MLDLKKLTKAIFTISILLLLNVSAIYPADYTGEREWMLRPMSARGAGMGSGLVAILDNANTVFWNPTGLAFINEINFSYNYDSFNSLLVDTDIRIKNISFNTKIKSVFSIGLNTGYYYNHGRPPSDIPETILEDFNLGIALGYKIKNIGFGTNIKYLFSDTSKNMYYSKGRTLAVDIGILIARSYNTKYNCSFNVNLAASLINIAKDLKVEFRESYNRVIKYERGLPKLFRVGYAATFNLPKKNVKLNPFSITHNLEYSEIINFYKSIKNKGYKFLGYGLEVILYEMFSFRIGNRSLKSKKYYADIPYIGFSYGFGLHFPLNHFYEKIPLSIKFDYARFPFYPESDIEELHYYKINSFSIQYMF